MRYLKILGVGRAKSPPVPEPAPSPNLMMAELAGARLAEIEQLEDQRDNLGFVADGAVSVLQHAARDGNVKDCAEAAEWLEDTLDGIARSFPPLPDATGAVESRWIDRRGDQVWSVPVDMAALVAAAAAERE